MQNEGIGLSGRGKGYISGLVPPFPKTLNVCCRSRSSLFSSLSLHRVGPFAMTPTATVLSWISQVVESPAVLPVPERGCRRLSPTRGLHRRLTQDLHRSLDTNRPPVTLQWTTITGVHQSVSAVHYCCHEGTHLLHHSDYDKLTYGVS